ncbi:FAD-dependent oxidoreductase [Streptomyces cinereoruber]|uniref:FAD-dependent oxidoreductase n=1 Tax=Streptomyces cinereoruber TaxID=67260 RepID=A0AAV4KC14_9ACTN|nr:MULTISPECIES: FAD-dependent oxidoreductase [Streptomyces]AVH99644.1 FAD-dependent oxidoreductase [Streptomyces sp. WAC00288]KYG56958.1 FAD-dependent oxidoreductase [Streptomyces sp. WAC04657]MBB4156739.1 glycine/D-amino acid oxidase-like deaminating enzyme [Streptomyces cinereoruber]MBY8815433.1 FAD-binding oxidoreductase [Streptomyces cinereoruber]NIH60163.1 glycine/D-amino acid oxidase-like deaminating enzyme [Streptomyces cinereoruber]
MSTVNGGISFWYAQEGASAPREPLPGDTAADVCIVGGGYTGLWTAYYLKKAVPFLNITVLEAKFCGYGASGRNGGWLYNGIAGRDRYARLHGHEAAVRLQQAMNATVAEVVDVCEREKIDADVHRGGVLEVALSPAQLVRLRDFHAVEIAFGETDRVMYGARETAERVRVTGAVGSSWTPHGARLHPVKLVKGLAAAVEALGVTIHESTPVTEIRPKHAVTPYGTVRAPYVLRCTEGFTASLAGQRRTWLPMNSSMIATEPLTDAQWESIGWEGRETLGDMAHAYMYAQRTADGRIALGGRGVPYRFGSKTDNDGRTQPQTVEALREILVRFFPQLAGVRIDHAWSGVLGVPRDWCATVTLDRSTGLGWAGGYVGSGVATANLAARTLRDLIQQDSGQSGPTDLTALPWVGHKVRKWEPEPLRWLGVQTMYAAFRGADRREALGRSARTDRVAVLANRLSGR